MTDRACTNHHCWGRDCCPNLQCECACHRAEETTVDDRDAALRRLRGEVS